MVEEMTVMERVNAVNLKQQQQQQQQQQPNQQMSNYNQQQQAVNDHHVSFSETTPPPLASSMENRRASVGSNKNTSRKNSTASSIREMGGVPPLLPALANASNLSLSSTSSNNSAAAKAAANRRQSGNSISIKITNDSLLIRRNNTPPSVEADENDVHDDQDPDRDQDQDQDVDTNNDRDEGEDTTSNSTSNESYPNNLKLMKKKSKERKKFVRSAAQQQHHLVYQESEDLGDEQVEPATRSTNDYPKTTTTNMNRAFDALFAAAETGNSSMSAIIEAKMAAEAVEAAADLKSPSPTESTAYMKKGSISSSRNGSIRSSRPKGLFSRAVQHDANLDAELYSSLVEQETQQIRRRLSNHLGSPQQLTRSVSCKRPGSFKKMKSKNASPNRNVIPAAAKEVPTNASTPSAENNSTTPTAGGARRGTQCSITIMEDIESKRQQNRAGSLPFENLIRPQTLAIPIGGDGIEPDGSSSAGTTDVAPPSAADVYRVRQFVTNKDSVINRGDSFKRSFKRSNQSLASNSIKKDTSRELPAIPAVNSNTLSLPEPKDGAYYMSSNNKTSSSSINETSFTNVENSSTNFGGIKLDPALVNESPAVTPTTNGGTVANMVTAANNMMKVNAQESVQTYVVYVLGSSSVGKNALIKQFKTSEYRGIYDICPQQSTDEEIEEGVSVLLDGLESKIQFISMDVDLIKPSSLFEITKDNDAFIIVYSISDKGSYNTALDLLKSIRTSENRIKPVILVGNKSDLVRKRSINRDDGANLALKYGCKFVETSVAINDKVDDLLAGILKQIRLNESLNRELALAPDERQTSFIETTKKNHVRNYSDAQLHDIIKKSNAATATPRQQQNRYLSFKSNTLTRRFFNKNRNKENLNFSDSEKSSPYGKATYGDPTSNNNTNTVAAVSAANNNTFSFFHKIYSTIFKKRSNSTQLQSVENLFTLPVSLNKSRKN